MRTMIEGRKVEGLRNGLRRLAAAGLTAIGLAAFCGVTGQAMAQSTQRAKIQVTGYVIDAKLDPLKHTLAATTKVSFTALDDISVATFELHNALIIAKITDASGAALTGERLPQESAVRVALTNPMTKGQSATWTFEYAGLLNGVDESPVEGLKLAQVGDPISYLLYAGRWFPMVGYLTNRYTAEIRIHMPIGYRVVGSGSAGGGRPEPGGQEFDFNWKTPGFPGTIIAGKFAEPFAVTGASNVRVYLTQAHQQNGSDLAQTALKEFEFFSNLFGQPETGRLNVVELPDDTVPAYWGPEVAAVMGAHTGTGMVNARLLANTIARQWWSSEVSPATLNDAWITNGMCRYGELMYVEDAAGKNALTGALQDVGAGALAYDTIPLASTGRLAPFSPEFQSMTLEKGAMVFHMLRWEMGDDAFQKMLRGVLSQFAGKGVKTSDVQKVAEIHYGHTLAPFFAQWLTGTGAPEFQNKFTVYRLGNNKGFRTIGQINQDLDLFSMPVELHIETDGKTVDRRIEVIGTDSNYQVDTFGRPRKIRIDPSNWVLKNSPEMKLRVHILRGQQLVAQGDNINALQEYQQALEANKTSSLASYRIGEVFFSQHNYQSSVNAYRDALRGDDEPKWTEVWSHIQIGKIFDLTGQRDRAVNEYRQALQTNDNTQGALNEARKFLAQPFKPADSGS